MKKDFNLKQQWASLERAHEKREKVAFETARVRAWIERGAPSPYKQYRVHASLMVGPDPVRAKPTFATLLIALDHPPRYRDVQDALQHIGRVVYYAVVDG